MKWGSVIPVLLLPLLLVYAGYLIWLVTHQREILFPGAKIRVSAVRTGDRFPVESVRFSAAGESCEMWVIPASDDSVPSPCVIFAHGNGEVIDECIPSVLPFRDMHFTAALVEYPGYGRCQGEPSEQSVIAAFTAAYDTLVQMPGIDPDRVLGYGRSLGAAAVCGLSKNRHLAGLILQSPFLSVTEMAKRRGVPGFLVRNKFDNKSAVELFPGPVLIFHGTQDPMIPFSHSEALLASAQNGRLIPMACGHNDCPSDIEKFWETITVFIRENRWDQAVF